MTEENSILKEFRKIPEVGKSIARNLYDLGIRSLYQLKDLNPEEMYKEHCIQKGTVVDRCVLYVFRCAVYYASNEKT